MKWKKSMVCGRMVRSELTAALGRDHPGLSAETLERIAACIFEAITEHLARGGRVELRRFGASSTRDRAARIGRNPRTGAGVAIAPKRALHFKPGEELREMVNKGKRPQRLPSSREG